MSEKNVEYFQFYRSFAEALRELEDHDRLSLYDGVVNFAFYGEEYEPSNSITDVAFKLIRPIIEKSIRNIANGRKGGRPSETEEEKEARYDIAINTRNKKQG